MAATEPIQVVLVTGIFLGVVTLCIALVRPETVADLLRGALRFGHVPDGVHLPMLLGAPPPGSGR